MQGKEEGRKEGDLPMKMRGFTKVQAILEEFETGSEGVFLNDEEASQFKFQDESILDTETVSPRPRPRQGTTVTNQTM